MQTQDLFAKSIQHAASCIRHVRPDHLGNATPCSEWDLRALLNHMVYELLWVPEIVKGKTIQDIGNRYEGDVLRTDAASAWQHAADAATVAVHAASDRGVAHLSYGDVPVMSYIREVGADLLIHAWDVGQALRATVLFDESLAQAVYDDLLPRKDELQKSGMFAPAISATEDAPLQIKLLSLTGRKAA